MKLSIVCLVGREPDQILINDGSHKHQPIREMKYIISVEISDDEDLKVLKLIARELGLCELHTAETIAQMAIEEAIEYNKQHLSE